MERISTTNAPGAIGPYSQAIKAGGFLFTSGQIPVDPATGLIPEGPVAQARQALTNVTNLIKAAGCDVNKTVKTVVFIQNMDDFAEINEVYAQFFNEPYPARSCVEVARLPKGVLIEVEAIVEL